MLVASPKRGRRVRSSITNSSIEAFPARSPMPLMVHSTWRAPAITPAREFATAMPRSLWQCTDSVTPSSSGTRSRSAPRISTYSSGTV